MLCQIAEQTVLQCFEFDFLAVYPNTGKSQIDPHLPEFQHVRRGMLFAVTPEHGFDLGQQNA
ncbi:hypothetical protein D1872_272240 [compost metagenome]